MCMCVCALKYLTSVEKDDANITQWNHTYSQRAFLQMHKLRKTYSYGNTKQLSQITHNFTITIKITWCVIIWDYGDHKAAESHSWEGGFVKIMIP